MIEQHVSKIGCHVKIMYVFSELTRRQSLWYTTSHLLQRGIWSVDAKIWQYDRHDAAANICCRLKCVQSIGHCKLGYSWKPMMCISRKGIRYKLLLSQRSLTFCSLEFKKSSGWQTSLFYSHMSNHSSCYIRKVHVVRLIRSFWSLIDRQSPISMSQPAGSTHNYNYHSLKRQAKLSTLSLFVRKFANPVW